MSFGTYVNGTITVEPMGRTNEEKEYVLKTVLNHLPRVTGSDGDMDVYIIRKNGYNSSCSCDEFGEVTNNLVDGNGYKSRARGWLRTQDEYILIVNGDLRNREFEQTYREFIKWLVRLCKRTGLKDILVEIKGYGKSTVIKNRSIQRKKYSFKSVFGGLYEEPSWCNDTGEVNWAEFMMWSRAKNSSYPMLLEYKYFNDEDNDGEVKRRLEYEKQC